jgi:hypothetical protein
VDDFLEHGKSCIKPGFDYFRDKFLSPQGPYFEVMQAYRAATLFNPMDMKGKHIAELELLIDDLSHFNFPELSQRFLVRIKKEIPTYKALMDREFNWSQLPGAEKYDKKAKDRGGSEDTWKADEAEVSRRIWEWWVVHRAKLTYFQDAVRLVALVQASSAGVERVFSLFKYIIETCQDHALADQLQLRLFTKVNKKYF